ncbi:hypothetical protein [Streptomyces sp. NPDC091215]|uniref:hypothetical protein n=1 Tax=Streptomyces sp. NPDC091215 TaxID=3155192 RepID=UPI00343075F0
MGNRWMRPHAVDGEMRARCAGGSVAERSATWTPVATAMPRGDAQASRGAPQPAHRWHAHDLFGDFVTLVIMAQMAREMSRARLSALAKK